jgi:hypothetical protein
MSARLHRSQYTRTAAGIVIGSAFTPRRELRTFTVSEERVQAALLAKPRRINWPSVLLAVAIGVAIAVLLALHLAGDI